MRVSGKGRRRGRCINYRHLIGGLRKKPRAFLLCKWQSDLLPTAEFRALWKQMKAQFERDQAVVLMVEALYIAATYDQEQAVAGYLSEALAKQQLTLRHLQEQFMPAAAATLPPIEAQQHALDSYDQLLSPADDTTEHHYTDRPIENSTGIFAQPLQKGIVHVETVKTQRFPYTYSVIAEYQGYSASVKHDKSQMYY